MEDLELQLEKSLKKIKELQEKNVLLSRANHALMKDLEKSHAENEKNRNLLNELNT